MRLLVSSLIQRTDISVLIVGLGYRTGLTSANFLAERGIEVTVSDIQSDEKLLHITSQLNHSVVTVLGRQNPEILDHGYDLIVLSPGVPGTIPLLKEAENRNIPIIAEVELAYYFMKGSWIAITGTDGKSTTTAMTDFILKKMGVNSVAGGNIGVPLITLTGNSTEKSVTVAELSSFQLESIDCFKPEIAVFLNLAPDHLDRYSSMDSYCDAKMRIARNMSDDDIFVYNLDDDYVNKRVNEVKCSTRSFSINNSNADSYFDGTSVFLHNRKVFSTDDLIIPGLHNIKNAMASLLLVSSFFEKHQIEFDFSAFKASLKEFTGLPHRLEYAGTVNGVMCINDSKATTVNAVKTAADSLKTPAVFIIGGRAKKEDYSLLADYLKNRAEGIVLLGESRFEFEKLFSEFNYVLAETMDSAVESGLRLCGSNGTLILSPGCSSFDMYVDYEQRGRDFVELVRKKAMEVEIGS
jgi:UDP-N-acetylmuramoylalanine--D-glutamate ligase